MVHIFSQTTNKAQTKNLLAWACSPNRAVSGLLAAGISSYPGCGSSSNRGLLSRSWRAARRDRRQALGDGSTVAPGCLCRLRLFLESHVVSALAVPVEPRALGAAWLMCGERGRALVWHHARFHLDRMLAGWSSDVCQEPTQEGGTRGSGSNPSQMRMQDYGLLVNL
ncbi:MAG: hypothetical protein WAW52_03220 [Methanothrix sp.]